MNIVLLTNSLSPHQIPLATEICKLVGRKNFTYIYTTKETEMRKKMGWKQESQPFKAIQSKANCDEVLNCDILLSGVRDMHVFMQRVKNRKITYYMSERWFKPPLGLLRIFYPSFLLMCIQFIKLLQYENFKYLPIGIHAAKDAIRLWKILNGRLFYFFREPKVAFVSTPGGAIIPLEEVYSALSESERKFAIENSFVQITKYNYINTKSKDIYKKMYIWGYFVEKSLHINQSQQRKKQVLWVGRMDKLKQLPSIIKACIRCNLPIEIFGHGDDEANCKNIASNKKLIKFSDYIPITEVRKKMHSSDIYIFGSTGADGWGAVVSEALSENMKVIGSIEAGASATLLSIDNLYHSGNVDELCNKIMNLSSASQSIGTWTPDIAAKVLLNL